MRIVIDLQGAQTESRFRGIGRYSLALATAIARNAGTHEIHLLLNGALQKSIPGLREAFKDLVPKERIHVFDIPLHVAEHDPANSPRTRVAERIREHVIAQLRPDAVLVTSLFEGFVDDAAVSVGTFDEGSRTAVILYDLIPLLNPAAYLVTPEQKRYYDRKIASLKNAGLLLAISDYSRQEGLDALGFAADRVVAISTAVAPDFRPEIRSAADLDALRTRLGIRRDMVMYAPGGFDARKNVDGLIQAYAMLPAGIRQSHQLVIASNISDASRQALIRAARQAGLSNDELILTGYIQDPDLRALYGMAKLFVFPSKHEGFGLPALEAMACGAPVIGSNSTSIPEVIGWDEALFDPASPQSIAESITRALANPELLDRLRQHGQAQSKKFSWDASARRALQAIEQRFGTSRDISFRQEGIRRLAFVSPLPPERTGIANYSLELLPALTQHFDVELVVDQPEVKLPEPLASLPRRSAQWFAENAGQYDRIVYQFGNSPFHSHMFGLLRRHPGVVVLHDFYLSGALAYEETSGNMPGVWTDALYQSHGYTAVQARFTDAEDAKRDFPCNLDVLRHAQGIIVHSEHSRELARRWYGQAAADEWRVIPHLRTPIADFDRAAARAALGLRSDAFIVCSFGFIDPTKQSLRLAQAWLASTLARDPNCELIFVGENHGGDYGKALSELARRSDARIRITGWTDDATYNLHLQAADAGVQLRNASRGETSGAVLHCLNHGMPIIVSANGSMADLPEDAVLKLADEFSDDTLVAALETLHGNRARRDALGNAGRHLIRTRHSPEACARQYADAIAGFHAEAQTDVHALMRSIADLPELPSDDVSMRQIARAIAGSSREPVHVRQLLVDVSAVARHDLRTGIERVVRAQLAELLKKPPSGFRVEPVYLSDEGGAWHYRYARRYACKMLGIEAAGFVDVPVDIASGDILYGPDLYPGGVIEAARHGLYEHWRARGVEINFLVHDLLPLLRPEFFPEGAAEGHAAWLDCVATHSDRLVCISQAVAAEVRAWLTQRGHDRAASLPLAVVHHGADIAASAPTTGLPDDASRTLEQISSSPAFLMVGTIEPRKGHLQALDAFEQLWAAGEQLNLVIVGKEGWTHLPDGQRRTIPRIVERLCHHAELGKRLFWLQGISDDYLQRVYEACSCLLFASEGEGFGLPLIEGARHGVPIIARDIPVFREVAGDHAFYFDGTEGIRLADAIRVWRRLHAEDKSPSSANMPWQTWAGNAEELTAVLLGRAENCETPAASSRTAESVSTPSRKGAAFFMEK